MTNKKTINRRIKLIKLSNFFIKKRVNFWAAGVAIISGTGLSASALSLNTIPGRLVILGGFLTLGVKILQELIFSDGGEEILHFIKAEKINDKLLKYNNSQKEKVIENIWHDLLLVNFNNDKINTSLKENYRLAFMEEFEIDNFFKKSKEDFADLYKAIISAYEEKGILATLLIDINNNGIDAYNKKLINEILKYNNYKISNKDQEKIIKNLDKVVEALMTVLARNNILQNLKEETLNHLIKKCDGEVFLKYKKDFEMAQEYIKVGGAMNNGNNKIMANKI